MATRNVLRNENGEIYSKQRVKEIQRFANKWRRRWLGDKTPMKVDGIPGRHTYVNLGSIQYHLGYGKDRKEHVVSRTMLDRMHYPHALKHPKTGKPLQSRQMRRTARRRRAAYKVAHRVNTMAATVAPGVGRFDGVPVRTVLIPHLTWARRNGWDGRLVSGWRSPLYSRSLCIRMCGRPSCPGRCAGTSSNHVRIAIDVSDYGEFGQLMWRCPHKPRIYNRLGPRDPVHFSPNGV